MSFNEDKREVTGIVFFFCAIVLTLIYYLPETITGFLGVWFRGLGFGLIGSAAFMIPVFLFYASVDYFLEKREGVAPIRVRSVIIFMICVSALFALFSMDFEFFRKLCADETGEKFKATKAIALLWKSGPDSSLITNPAGSAKCLPGGLVGGGIAVALNKLAGKTVSILAMFVLLLSQVILVFHVSLKKTAKKTAKAIGHASKKAYNTVRDRYNPRYPQYGSRPQRGPAPQQQMQPYQSGRSPFVNSPTEISGVPLFEHERYKNQAIQAAQNSNQKDPFGKRIPVDSKTGFMDVSDREFGADTTVDPNNLNYGVRRVSTAGAADAPTAEFDYTPLPKTAPLMPRRQQPEAPSFLRNDNSQQDFYDLQDGVYAGDPEHMARFQAAAEQQSYQYDDQQDLPYQDQYSEGYNDYDDPNDFPEEITDEDPYDYTQNRTVRAPHISMGGEPAPAPYTAPAAPAAPVSPAPVSGNGAIPINQNLDNEGFSNTEGRIVETPKSVPGANVDVTTGRIKSRRKGPYRPAPLTCLEKDQGTKNANNNAELQAKAKELEEALGSFGINAQVINITHGPAITRFELTIDRGVKVSRVLSLQDDIALAMAAVSVRIEAPIPGKSAIGIEIPNKKTSAVQLRGLLETKEFRDGPGLEVPLGKDIPGRPIMCNIAKMPHLLIAGSTGSGKSVCINTILTSILCKASPDDVRMILVDPKVVELSVYNGIPHLLMPVVTDPKKASNALKWAVIEMERRYKCFSKSGCRDLSGYNEYLKYNGEKPLPLILIVIDELADLMTVAAKEVEDQIARLAAMARAAGLHLLIATQRPSVDVITGVIKSNVPSRIAFAVSSGVDSRTILDSVGAEKLLGKGDMLYSPLSAPKPVRGQGAFVSDKEVEAIVKYLKDNYGPLYDDDIMKAVETPAAAGGSAGGAGGDQGGSDEDDLLDQAVNTVIDAGNASVSILQRRLGIGYPRAARLIDVMEQKHIIGPFEGSKPRKVLINKTDWLEMQSKGDA